MTVRNRSLVALVTFTVLLLSTLAASAKPDFKAVSDYQATADKIFLAASQSKLGYQRLATLCTHYPRRLSGSRALEKAIDWAVATIESDEFDALSKDPVMVPHWKRGAESLVVLGEEPYPLEVLGLGGSIATSPEGIEAPIFVAESFEDLEKNKALALGKIVVFNVPFTTYGQTGAYRWEGPSKAASFGAVACLVRSVTPYSLSTLHTGGMEYDQDQPKIPAAAISPEAAQSFARRQAAGLSDRVRLKLASQMLPDALSHNVSFEIRGWQHPEQVVVMGGHIDSWDVCEGAQDDGGGIMMCWEALRLIKELNLKPRRTIRVVFWTNEENGTRGAKAYKAKHESSLKDHVLAMESDYGTFQPSGFSFSGSDKAGVLLSKVLGLLEKTVGPMSISKGGAGADINPLVKEGVPGIGLDHKDERYFWYHHSPADSLEKVDIKDFQSCVATMAVTAFVIADLPERLSFGSDN